MTDVFLETAARWAVDLRWRDLPPDVRRAAGAQRLSALGAVCWTHALPVGERIVRTVRAEHGTGSDGTATLLGAGPVSPRAAAYGHAALGMALDFDDTVLGGHTGHSAVFVPLAYAEAGGVDWRRAVVAHVAANEIAARVASAAAVGPFRGQQTAYVHALCAAVGRAVVEGDDAETLADAMAIALSQPPWPLEAAFLGSDAKVLTAAEPVLSGLSAVSAAREGLTGKRDLVTTESGFLDSFADYPLPEFLDGLPERDPDDRGDRLRPVDGRWHTRAVTVKAHPGCAYVSAPVEAALDARRQLDDAFDGPVEVSHVTVEASLFTTQVDERAGRYVRGPDSTLAALNFSVAYNVATALLDAEHTPRQFRPARRGSRDVWELADRVELRHDSGFTMDALRSEVPLGAMLRRVGPLVLPYSAKTVGVGTTLRNLPTLLRFVRKRPLPTDLSRAEKRLGARVTVHLSDGGSVTAECRHPTGFAGRPLSETRAVARRKLAAALTELAEDSEGERSEPSGRASGATASHAPIRPTVDALREPEGPVSLSRLAGLLDAEGAEPTEVPTP
jgi:2-methylcitrate dehydratase PrpD